MKALLTGITGNLGFEVSLDLARRGVRVVPCVRPGNAEALRSHPIQYHEWVECDLTEVEEIHFAGKVDCIIHCAGAVHFRDAGNKNEQMMLLVTSLAKKLGVPIYAVSTAFVYRPPAREGAFHNAYEEDKFRMEEVLKSSGVPHSIFRPSVLTGNSHTGEIRNFSGYYRVVGTFLSAIGKADEQKRELRFPRMLGESNMVPVDQAARYIGNIVEEGHLGETFYITNPTPPRSAWVLDETLDFYGVRNKIDIMDVPFKEFGTIDLTEEEASLYRFASHFNPYWSMEYEFPPSICNNNLIDHEYILRVLTRFRDTEHGTYGTKTN